MSNDIERIARWSLTHSNWLQVDISSGDLYERGDGTVSKIYTECRRRGERRASKEVPNILSLTKDMDYCGCRAGR